MSWRTTGSVETGSNAAGNARGQGAPQPHRVSSPRASTVVDATLIAAPNSTRNALGKRDPQMKQNGNQWLFDMKAHVGVEAESGYAASRRAAPTSRQAHRRPAWDAAARAITRT
jgi:hypothetical protein